MGYYTMFELSMEGEKEKVEKAESDFKKLYKKGYLDTLVNCGYDELKWYDWETDVQKVARKNPDVLIILYGDGDSCDDNWQMRAKGKEYEIVQRCFPPFENPNLRTEDEKLKDIFINQNKDDNKQQSE